MLKFVMVFGLLIPLTAFSSDGLNDCREYPNGKNSLVIIKNQTGKVLTLDGGRTGNPSQGKFVGSLPQTISSKAQGEFVVCASGRVNATKGKVYYNYGTQAVGIYFHTYSKPDLTGGTQTICRLDLPPGVSAHCKGDYYTNGPYGRFVITFSGP